MRFACWIFKATDTHSEYVILIEFPLQQRLHEHASKLRYTHGACLVYYVIQPSKRLSLFLGIFVDSLPYSFSKYSYLPAMYSGKRPRAELADRYQLFGTTYCLQ